MFASPPNYADWQTRSRSLDQVGAYTTRAYFVGGGDETLRVEGAQVSASLFRTIGVTPALGRAFHDEEDRPGAERVVVLGYSLWQRRFGADPDILGQTVSLDTGDHTVIGVMPPDFEFPPPIDLEGRTVPRRNELWVPLALDYPAQNRSAHYLTVIARLRDEATRDAASAEMRALATQMQREYPESNADYSIAVIPFDRVVIGEARTALLVLMAAVALVLLIACVNIANLLLARASGRKAEYAVRAALGAGRTQLMRHAVIESQTLALLGGAAGLFLAFAGVRLLVKYAPPIPRLDQAGIDGAAVAFALLLSVLTGLLFGLVPAIRAFTPNLIETLREGGRTSADAGATSRMRAALVIAEVAFSLVLLVGAGLLFASFLSLRGVEPGVQPDRVLTLRLTLPQVQYPDATSVTSTFREIVARVRTLQGVEAAGLTLNVPLASDHQGTRLVFEGEPGDPDASRSVHFSVATPGYLEAMGIPVMAGRSITDADAAGAPPTVLVNETLARTFLSGQDPIGRRIEFGGLRTIVGVTGSVRLERLDADPLPAMIFPLDQFPGTNRNMSLAVRTRGEPLAMLDAVRQAVRSVDARIPIYNVKSMEQVMSETLAEPRFSSLLLVAFSVVALALAAVGIYGVIAFMVNQRTREIGIRMALGARPADALGLVVGQAMRLVLAGVGIGLALSLAAGRSLEGLLFGVRPADPLTLASVSAFLLLVALAACGLPALRASRVDPIRALRLE
jgi:putative ABC transport system permease protein